MFRNQYPHTLEWGDQCTKLASICFFGWAVPLSKLKREQSVHHRLRVVEEVAADVADDDLS